MSANAEKIELEEAGFVVTTFGSRPEPGKSERSVLTSGVWDGKRPYGLGHPFRWALERTGEGAQIRRLEGPAEEVIAQPLRVISQSELAGRQPIELDSQDGLWLTLHPLSHFVDETPTWAPEPLAKVDLGRLSTDRFFRLVLFAVALAVGVGLVGLHFVPTKKVETELIPPEFAKVLLSPSFKAQASKERTAEGIAKGNVVQAIRSQAVQKTVRTLLDPSAAKSLLSRTSLLHQGQAREAVRKVFDAKSTLGGKTGLGGIDMKEVGKAIPETEVGRQGDYRGGAATSTAGGGSSLEAIAFDSIGVSEGLTKDEIGKVIREHVGEIRYCYEAALARSPGLEGKLLVSFTVDGNGAVKDVVAKESSGNLSLDRCIQTRLLKWKFPKPKQGVDIGVTYPFIFKALGD